MFLQLENVDSEQKTGQEFVLTGKTEDELKVQMLSDDLFYINRFR